MHRQRSSAADKDKQKDYFDKKTKLLKLDMAATFNTPEGRRVLKHLFKTSGFGESNIGGNPTLGMDILQGTIYNAARQSMYLELRKLIPHETLKVIEFDNLEEILE